MRIKPFKKQSSKIHYSNKRWKVISTLVHTPDGDQSWEQLVSKAPAVVIIAVNNNDEIAVISQNRLDANGNSKIVHELPSGWMETGTHNVTDNEILEEANRELQEEIGYRANKIKLLSNFNLSNFAVVPFNIIFASDLEKSELPADEGEHILVEWLPVDEAKKKLIEDQIPTAQVALAISEYDRCVLLVDLR